MVLRIQERFATGAYADIFRPPPGATVYKVFASAKHSKNVGQGPNRLEDDERRHNTFISECRAYELVAHDPFLTSHIPQFLGPCVISDITDAAGKSILDCYIPDHCYAMEYIEGPAIKLGSIPVEGYPDHIKAALRAFYSAGVRHLSDVSIFSPSDPTSFKFIDFATEEFR